MREEVQVYSRISLYFLIIMMVLISSIKNVGILSILDEQSFSSKFTDQSFT